MQNTAASPRHWEHYANTDKRREKNGTQDRVWCEDEEQEEEEDHDNEDAQTLAMAEWANSPRLAMAHEWRPDFSISGNTFVRQSLI